MAYRRSKIKTTVVLLPKESYLAVIKNSIGAKVWQQRYARVDGKRRDLVEGGRLSCAFFVSTVLKISSYITDIHVTVTGTIKDLQKNNWKKVRSIKPGDILIWETKKDSSGKEHSHIGFALNKTSAVSNSTQHRSPQKHHITYHHQRNIIAIYRLQSTRQKLRKN